MKKTLLVGAFTLVSFFSVNAQQKISQNNNTTLLEAGGSVGCPSGDNAFSRSFVLSGFGITEAWQISEVEFGLQDYAAGGDIIITLSTTSSAYPGGTLTQLAQQTVTFEDDGQSLFVMKQVPMTATVPAGSELVVEIAGNDFFIGGNKAGSTAPSYLKSVACSTPNPVTATSLNFPDVNFVINVTGSSTAGVNEILASKFSVSPNPSNDVINISNNDSILLENIAIADLNGRNVKSLNYSDVANAQINISDLASGMYMMTISSDKGTFTKKIIKN